MMCLIGIVTGAGGGNIVASCDYDVETLGEDRFRGPSVLYSLPVAT